MITPDQSHINRVREALWHWPESGASILVGAGFSRNAKKAGPHAGEFPLWHEITKLLCERLYPAEDDQGLKRALAEASGSSGFLRLAQEYQSAFGRGALHKLIFESVPNDNYIPDELHTRLLRLPWRDIFTTNWDTLLERSCPLVTNRSYSIVRTYEELPSSPRPRIVKLHGSFPAHFPFIFTEEDYRTYPKRFAPFVNTVQQAMMETIVLLIGFSGDDPNFLHWSGWVRDNLGEAAPKIYLAGWLDLSPHRRRMLEDRNVVPIDISRHPQAQKWPEHLRHRYATEWLLHTLEYGRPYNVTAWPSSPDWSQRQVPNALEPVEKLQVNAPQKEPDPPIDDVTQNQIRSVIQIWAHNRAVYPGWLFLPPSKNILLSHSTRRWEQSILNVLPSLTVLERLSALYELVWRKEISLQPLSDEVVEAIQSTLSEIDCEERKIATMKESKANWIQIRQFWRNLAISSLKMARLNLDQAGFERWKQKIQPFIDDCQVVAQTLHYEESLWALYNFDFKKLENLVANWSPEGYDPIWMARKAAILIEINRNDEAVLLINRGLSIVRETTLHNTNLASLSREGWLLWLAMPFHRPFISATKESIEVIDPFDRLTELAPMDCDSRDQRRDMLVELRGEPEKKKAPLFDLGARHGETIYLSNVEYERWNTAQRGLRLCEVAGLPSRAEHMVVASDILKISTEQLKKTDPALSFRMALRLASSEDDEVFNNVWSRKRIAALAIQEVDSLFDITCNAIDYVLPRVRNSDRRDSFWVTKLRVVMEAASRLVLRMSPDKAESLLKRTLKYYSIESVSTDHWLCKVIENLLNRSWEAMPKCDRIKLIPDLLIAPLGGLNDFGIADQRYPDPGQLFNNEDAEIRPVRDAANEDRWAEIIQLILRGLRHEDEARQRAASRLVPLVRWDILHEHETEQIAQALWQTNKCGNDILPTGTSLYDWVFLLLPEPKPNQAEVCFRKKWLCARETNDEKSINEVIWQIGNSLASLRRHDRSLPLTEIETQNLSSLVNKWIELPVTKNDDLFNGPDITYVIAGLQFILTEIFIPTSTATDLFGKIEKLNSEGIPAYRICPILYKVLPDRATDIELFMRMGLASDNIELAEDATLGLEIWLKLAAMQSLLIPVPPSDLVREIGVIIATRRKGVLNRALQAAKWIFSDGTSNQRETILNLTLHGLSFLIEELSYDRTQGDEETDVPLLRWGCAHLALAMSSAGLETDQTIIRWVEISQNDPLPEVRYARPDSTNITMENN
ncbi:SIR2 family protein [Methylomonas sp. EFPC1]|uniref:SIR2 family NAD-dependent protein deacylase n=1 Tax=Methylomonas sp. EFPC1 TaxID=2812647 RepID=UPI001968346E|nr:SIR2 family protein [Methylomonas sp. EFPC1]QSB03115.1 SIR2 family protein [Methylomonas sp. EFPC1]